MKPSWFFWLVVTLWAGAGGPACTCDGSKDSPVSPPRACTLLISGTSIQYNGRVLPLPGSLEDWVQLLGPHSRKVEVADDVYVWDQLGIYSTALTSSTVLRSIAVQLNPPDSGPLEAPRYLPRSTFQGRLCVDGSEITPHSRIEEVNRNKQGQLFARGYLDTIYSYDIASPTQVYVRIDLTNNERPESFYMGFSNEVP
ncbi:hypothetical protein [Archangium sp. Cb G35]|uniref:DUF7738 domain-containing protein n=1 Tax=Archangium sp. Cb G35 TaxID=1920190 RepID=UPI000A588698|nr:hypothetical protein [Archangium sp. Cb G35]